jgi:ADP-ribose pyrophosphatase YjhB (NUDIX family)
MTDTPRHSVSVAGIVVNASGQILVIQRRDNGHWEPPGGVLELEESFEDGVAREVLEETGVSIRVDRLTGVYKNLQRGVVALVFRCTPLGRADAETAEAKAIRWVAPNEVAALMDPAYAVRVTDAFDTGDVAIRAHDGVRLVQMGV